jgi:hypothetical protein
MWIRKGDRDRKRGVDSPMPTQVVSNEEFIPRPQTTEQKQIEHLIGELSILNSKKLGMDRRDFMRTQLVFWLLAAIDGPRPRRVLSD